MSLPNTPSSANENAGQPNSTDVLKTKLLAVTQHIRERIEANGQNVYFDHQGNIIPLDGLDPQEQAILADLIETARNFTDDLAFTSYWMPKVAQFYDARGQAREVSRLSPIYRIAQDLNTRLHIYPEGTRPVDYRDELEIIVISKFRTRQSFCNATGLDAKTLKDVLAHRAHFPIEILRPALAKIGYRVRRKIEKI